MLPPVKYSQLIRF